MERKCNFVQSFGQNISSKPKVFLRKSSRHRFSHLRANARWRKLELADGKPHSKIERSCNCKLILSKEKYKLQTETTKQNHKNFSIIKLNRDLNRAPEISCKSQNKIQAEAKITKQITGCNRLSTQLQAMLGEGNKKLKTQLRTKSQ